MWAEMSACGDDDQSVCAVCRVGSRTFSHSCRVPDMKSNRTGKLRRERELSLPPIEVAYFPVSAFRTCRLDITPSPFRYCE